MSNLFIAVWSIGLGFYDKSREANGDYLKVAFLSYRSLALQWYAKTTPDMRAEIEREAQRMQVQRGQPFAISTCGQTITLGE